MYGCRHLVAGSPTRQTEAAIWRWLASEGLRVVRRVEHDERTYRRFRWLPLGADEPPNLSWFELADSPAGPTLVVEQRAERHAAWNFRFARALSKATGGIALTWVSDRLRDEYGRAAYWAGRTIEATARDVVRLEFRAGGSRLAPEAAVFASCDEDANQRAFDRWWARAQGREDPEWWNLRTHRVTSLVLERTGPAPSPTAFPDPSDEGALGRAAVAGLEAERVARALGDAGWRAATVAPPLDWSAEAVWEPAPVTLLEQSRPDASDVLNIAIRLGAPLAAVAFESAERPLRTFSWHPRTGARRGEAFGFEAFLAAWGNLRPLVPGAWPLVWPPT